MNAIGGFLPLEIAPGGAPHHPDAIALASGRACWHVILRQRKPSQVFVPFYVCDAVLQPLVATRTPYTFYPIGDSFAPEIDREPRGGELLLAVNYFGVMTSCVEATARRLGERVAVDDTQAYFRRGARDHWSFNSARKFFGVPDGAYLYGPAVVDGLPPSDIADCDHLLTRLAGDDQRAWDQFRQHEARIGIDPRAMSTVSARLLGAVDLECARLSRQANFDALHRRLRSMNTIRLPLDGVAAGGPMCYPFLPAVDVDREALSRRGVFVPTLWPEIATRPEAGFERERRLARRLLPLPIDHRYRPHDMDRVADSLLQVLA